MANKPRKKKSRSKKKNTTYSEEELKEKMMPGSSIYKPIPGLKVSEKYNPPKDPNVVPMPKIGRPPFK